MKKSWEQCKADDLVVCRLIFEIASIGIDYLFDSPDPDRVADVEAVCRKLEDQAREIEHHYAANRRSIGNNGGRRR